MDEPALLTTPVQVHVIVRACVGFCAVRAHERFGQCASAVGLCRTAREQEHLIVTSRALCSCVWACTDEFMYENQYLSTVLAPQGFVLLCTSVQYEPPRASYSVLVRAPQGFVLLCASVRYEPKRTLCGANPEGRYTVCWYPPTRALYPMLMCLRGSVLSEPARACASVYCTSPKSFVGCEPTKALYSVRQGLCVCVLYEPQELYAVRAYKGSIQCASARSPGLCTECLCARAVV